jgi:hypothetical protein
MTDAYLAYLSLSRTFIWKRSGLIALIALLAHFYLETVNPQSQSSLGTNPRAVPGT